MTVEQALISALECEQRVRNHYISAAKGTDDPKGREIFLALAEEEQSHIDFLNQRLAHWRKEGRLGETKLTSMLPSKKWLEEGKAKMASIQINRSYDNEVQMLRVALALEKEVSDHYSTLAEQMDGDAKLLFRRFLEIESAHTAIVQAELDALEGNGFWFDFAEFNLEG